ncbi:MAG TPA: inner membrane-spanning protein YciB, partial [Candidatus Limnocylindrales bacterium]
LRGGRAAVGAPAPEHRTGPVNAPARPRRWLRRTLLTGLAFGAVVALLLAWLLERRVPLVPLITAAIVAVFGGLTLWLQDETFIKMKPTIVQAVFALVLLGGLAFGRPLLKPLLGAVMPPLSERAWRQFTLRYALFFVAMAALNELVWRTQSTDFWVTFKVFGLPGLTVLFVLSQIPFVGRQARLAEAGGARPARSR